MRALARLRASEPALVPCALIAAALCCAVFLLQGRIGINLQDESFLWYGAIRTHAGELPLRDFRAYDPGRYFWCAGWIALFGDGLVAIRAAGWAFAALGVTAGLLVVSRSMPAVQRGARLTLEHGAWLAATGAVLVAWMAPPWKLYESSLAMLVAWIAVRLIECPSTGRRIAAGLVVGIAAFFGRNLGVYAGLALLVVTLLTCWKLRQNWLRSFIELGAGTLVGYAPMLALVLFADGYSDAFRDSIAFYARQGALNAELPFPFPWRIDFSNRTAFAATTAAVVGSLFLVVPATYAALIARGAFARGDTFMRWAPFTALSCVGAMWFHHASVRSDLPHLAQSAHPFLLVIACLPWLATPARARLARAASWCLLAVLTGFGIATSSPAVRRAMAPEGSEYTTVRVGHDDLSLAPKEVRLVQDLLAAMDANVGPEDELWVSAQLVGLYPILGRRAPTWDIYPAWQADEAEQDRMLSELATVRWALIDVRPIGGDSRMRLEISHPRVWRWLIDSFERVPLPGVSDNIVLLRRKS